MPFNLTVDGITQKLSANGNHKNSALNYLEYTTVVRMSASQRGFLEIVFDNGVVITMPSDDAEFQYEAWCVHQNTGLRMFTMIGGAICI